MSKNGTRHDDPARDYTVCGRIKDRQRTATVLARLEAEAAEDAEEAHQAAKQAADEAAEIELSEQVHMMGLEECLVQRTERARLNRVRAKRLTCAMLLDSLPELVVDKVMQCAEEAAANLAARQKVAWWNEVLRSRHIWVGSYARKRVTIGVPIACLVAYPFPSLPVHWRIIGRVERKNASRGDQDQDRIVIDASNNVPPLPNAYCQAQGRLGAHNPSWVYPPQHAAQSCVCMWCTGSATGPCFRVPRLH